MNRSTLLIGLIVAAAYAFAMLVSASSDQKTPERNPTTRHCERSWENSAIKEIGGSKRVFMERCHADMKALREAVR